MYDLESCDYTRFLDEVRTRDKLIKGLCSLSPFADDALDAVVSMNETEFISFKLALARERGLSERRETGTAVDPAHMCILVPEWFIRALPIAQEFNAALGVALLRLMEHHTRRGY